MGFSLFTCVCVLFKFVVFFCYTKISKFNVQLMYMYFCDMSIAGYSTSQKY